MSLYQIMVVDDEAEVRQGIVQKIDWNTLGFEMVADAENGRDALEKAESLALDVVLTDIKMPFMDGLELGAELIRRKPNVKLIIFSGFDEFELAQEAIKLNVVEYVLKPVNAEELSRILQRVKHTLDNEIEERRNIAQLTDSYRKNLPLLRERFLHKLLSSRMDAEEISRQMERFGMPVREGRYKAVAACDIAAHAEGQAAVDAELAPTSVRQVLDSILRPHCRVEFYMSLSSVILVTAWEKEPVEELMRLLTEACSECARVFGVSVTVGLGRPCGDAGEIHRSYAEAKAALEYKAVSGAGRVIYIGDMEHTDTGDDAGMYQDSKLLAAIKFGFREQIAACVNELIFGGEEDWSPQVRLLSVLGALMPLIRHYRLEEQEILGERSGWLALLAEDTPREKVRDWLLPVCLRMSGSMAQHRVTAAKKLVEEAERYIREKYAESSISVDRLCSHLHISQSYFSNIFKQETGRSYVQYLTDVRMDHAAALLRGSDDKTYLVAAAVGYDDPNYFSYVFKKKFGLSPSQYRK